MRTGSDQVQVITFDLVDEKPVWLDVAVAVVAPVARQGMVFIPGRQRPAIEQQQYGLSQFCCIFAAPLRQFYVAMELGAVDGGSHRSDPQFLKESAGGR
jgi:hypothetical protein